MVICRATHRTTRIFLAAAGLCALLWVLPAKYLPVKAASHIAQESVVRALLFYSPDCTHCHEVIYRRLPPLYERYGEQLQIEYIDISRTKGAQVFAIVKAAHGLKIAGVPTLAVGETLLMGSKQIPDELPHWIDTYLAQGGVDLPALPGLADALQDYLTTAALTATPTARPSPPAPSPTPDPPLPGAPTPGASTTAPPSSPWHVLAVALLAAAFLAVAREGFNRRQRPRQK